MVKTSNSPASLSTSPTNPASPLLTANPQPEPAGAFMQAFLNISSTTNGQIGSGFAGLSYEKSSLFEPLFTDTNADLIHLFKLLGPGVLRVGGNSVDQTVWTPNGKGQTAGQIAPADVQALGAFLQQTGWSCIYGVNLGGAATGATTPTLAAAEAEYVAQTLGAALVGVEIGNECDCYGAANSYFAGNWSLAQFETLWNQFRAAIVAAVPSISITGPASGSNVDNWTVPFGQTATSYNLSMLTQHYYRGDGKAATSTAANLISADSNLTRCLNKLSTGAQSIGIPFRLGECSSYFNGGAVGVSNAYASSLWVLDFLFTCAQGGAAGVNLHGGGNAPGYTPIADNHGDVVEARPEFYGMKLFTMAGQGSMCQTTLSTGGLNATAYAVKSASGTKIVVINKDSSQSLNLTTTLPQSISSAKLTVMTQSSTGNSGPSLAATSGVTIQGAGIGADGGFAPSDAYNLSTSGSQLSCYVPALSAVLIEVK